MPLFGVHESIAEGFDQAVFNVAKKGFESLQIFSKNSNRWSAKPIPPEVAKSTIVFPVKSFASRNVLISRGATPHQIGKPM